MLFGKGFDTAVQLLEVYNAWPWNSFQDCIEFFWHLIYVRLLIRLKRIVVWLTIICIRFLIVFQRYNWKVSDNEMCKACQQYFMRMRNKFNVVQNMKVTKLFVFVWTNHPQLLCYFQTAFVAGFLSKYFCYVITI